MGSYGISPSVLSKGNPPPSSEGGKIILAFISYKSIAKICNFEWFCDMPPSDEGEINIEKNLSIKVNTFAMIIVFNDHDIR